MIRKHTRAFLFFFIVGGLLAAGYGLQHHYAPVGTAVCNVSRRFNCDIVNKSAYSEILGFPVAGIGLIGYLMMGVIAFMNRKDRDRTLDIALVALAAGGVVFSLYLTYIEAFVLYTWCLICLGSLSSIIGVLLTSVMLLKETETLSKEKPGV